MSNVIFYDIPSSKGPWSPNTWKVRLALNYKKIAYKTHWLTYPEIEPYFKSIGAPSTGTRPDTGAPLYTCPALSVDGKIVVDSDAILEYLDAAFPFTPRLFPPGTRALQAAFGELFSGSAFKASAQVLLPGVPEILEDAGAEYFRATRLAWYGSPLSEWAPLGSQLRGEKWKATEEGWAKIAAVYAKREGGGPFLTGAQPVAADLLTLSTLAFFEKAVPTEEFTRLLGVQDGVWGKLWEAGKGYLQED